MLGGALDIRKLERIDPLSAQHSSSMNIPPLKSETISWLSPSIQRVKVKLGRGHGEGRGLKFMEKSTVTEQWFKIRTRGNQWCCVLTSEFV